MACADAAWCSSEVLQRVSQSGRVERPVDPEGPRKRTPAFCEIEALEAWMHVCSAPGSRAEGVGDENQMALNLAHYHPKQLGCF